jgi:WD40 repeat protein
VRVWDATSGAEVVPPIRGHEDMVISVAFSPDGTRIVSGSHDKTVRVWDAVSGVELVSPLRGHEGSVHTVAFSPDGTRIASGSDDKTVRVWDAMSGTEIVPPFRGHEGWVLSVSFSADGARITSISGDDNIRMWDSTTGKLYNSNAAQVESPGPIKIVKGFWVVDVKSNRTITQIPPFIRVQCLDSSGRMLAIGTIGGQVIIIQFPEFIFSSPETRPV